MKIPIDLFIKSYFMMDVLWVIFLVIMYGLILFILIKLEKERKELIQEYNELVDDYNCQYSLIEHYEYKIWELLKKLRELNNLTLDNNENEK